MTLRLFLLAPTTVFAARVAQASFTYPIAEVEFDGVTTGAFGDIESGMTVLFGSGAGADNLGRTRTRKPAGATTLYFGRSSLGYHDGEVALEDNAYITVLDDYRVWSKMPHIETDGTIYKNHDLVVAGRTSTDIPPKANSNDEGFAATIDSGTSLITASWDASTKSFAVTDGATISSYLWDVGDGTITVGTSASAAITATFPAGFRWVKLTVTDSNANTHARRIPVLARNPASDATISGFNIESHRITPQGQQISFRIREAIPEATYPDGTLVMLWEDEPASASDRSHMLFVGWHHNDPADILVQRTGILQDTVFECLDVAGKLDTLPGFPQSIEGNDSPATWTEMSSPNVDKYLHYLLHWHSTALDVADFTWSETGSDYPFVLLWADGESLFDQVDRKAKALVPDYRLVCNRHGQLMVIDDPMLQDIGDRTATEQATITEGDWTSIRYGHQKPPRVHWLRGDAILADASNISALFCISPGTTPGQGEIEAVSNLQLAKSQSDLNTVEGHHYARMNAPFGLFSVTMSEDTALEPANMTWVTLAVSAGSAAQRGWFASNRFLISEINISYEHNRTGLAKTVELLLEKEVSGNAAVTYEVPVDDIPDPEFDPPPPPTYDPGPGTTPGTGFGTNHIFLSNVLARTRDLSVASPTYVDITGTITGTSYDFILDPWNVTTRAFALTSTGVWRLTGMDVATPTIAQVLSVADANTLVGSSCSFQFKIQASINVENYIALFVLRDKSGGSDYELYCFYSEDAGDTWNTSLIDDSTWIADNRIDSGGGFDVVPRLINGDIRIYVAYEFYKLSGGTPQYRIKRSDDRGATWTLVKTITKSSTPNRPTILNTPYDSNESGNIGWLGVTGGVITTDARIYKTTDGFSNVTEIELGGADLPTLIKRLGIEIYIQNSNQVAIWTSTNQLFKSTDGSSFSEISYSGYVPGTHGNVCAAGGFPSAAGQYYIVTDTRYVFVSTNGGVTWTNKTGNLQSIIGSDDPGVSGIEKGVIVPVWTEE